MNGFQAEFQVTAGQFGLETCALSSVHIFTTLMSDKMSGSAPDTLFPCRISITPSHASVGKIQSLDQFRGTAISANPVLASILFLVGLEAMVAGPLAPLALFLVGITMLPMRFVFTEVCSAVTMNGGSYSIVLNASTKSLAAIAASFSLLSYCGTNIFSAVSAAAYIASQLPSFPVYLAAILAMCFFALVALAGTKESSVLALIIVGLHCLTLATVLAFCCVHWYTHGNTVLQSNFAQIYHLSTHNILRKLFDGYCVGMLGCTGFETAANFVEEVRPGCFAKIMRNLWWMIALVNAPAMFILIAVLPIQDLADAPVSAWAIVAHHVGGNPLRIILVVDAVLILCGGMLTANIGISGLVARLSSDGLLPSWLVTRRFPLNQVPFLIPITFLLTCLAIFLLVNGSDIIVSQIYGVAFIGVLSAFTLGSLILKVKRPLLPRDYTLSTPITGLTLACLAIAIVGNFLLTPDVALYFFTFFLALLLPMLTYMYRAKFARLFIYFCTHLPDWMPGKKRILSVLYATEYDWMDYPVMIFIRTPDLAKTTKAVFYVLQNEPTHYVILAHVSSPMMKASEELGFARTRHLIAEAHPKLRIELMMIDSHLKCTSIHPGFSPEIIHEVEQRVPHLTQSMMFVGCPGTHSRWRLQDFSGLRIIMQ